MTFATHHSFLRRRCQTVCLAIVISLAAAPPARAQTTSPESRVAGEILESANGLLIMGRLDDALRIIWLVRKIPDLSPEVIHRCQELELACQRATIGKYLRPDEAPAVPLEEPGTLRAAKEALRNNGTQRATSGTRNDWLDALDVTEAATDVLPTLSPETHPISTGTEAEAKSEASHSPVSRLLQTVSRPHLTMPPEQEIRLPSPALLFHDSDAALSANDGIADTTRVLSEPVAPESFLDWSDLTTASRSESEPIAAGDSTDTASPVDINVADSGSLRTVAHEVLNTETILPAELLRAEPNLLITEPSTVTWPRLIGTLIVLWSLHPAASFLLPRLSRSARLGAWLASQLRKMTAIRGNRNKPREIPRGDHDELFERIVISNQQFRGKHRNPPSRFTSQSPF